MNATDTIKEALREYVGDGDGADEQVLAEHDASVLSAALNVEEMARDINEALMGYHPGTHEFDGTSGAWNARDDEIDVIKVAARLRSAVLARAGR